MIYTGTIVFYMYINDLPDKLVSFLKFFADDISLFFTVYDTNASRDVLNDNLKIISGWVRKWKMQFNPDLNKQAQDVS